MQEKVGAGIVLVSDSMDDLDQAASSGQERDMDEDDDFALADLEHQQDTLERQKWADIKKGLVATSTDHETFFAVSHHIC
jgi:hypothetical protein